MNNENEFKDAADYVASRDTQFEQNKSDMEAKKDVPQPNKDETQYEELTLDYTPPINVQDTSVQQEMSINEYQTIVDGGEKKQKVVMENEFSQEEGNTRLNEYFEAREKEGKVDLSKDEQNRSDRSR